MAMGLSHFAGGETLHSAPTLCGANRQVSASVYEGPRRVC